MEPAYGKAFKVVEQVRKQSLPFKERGIEINRALIKAAIEILGNVTSKTLPQNCRNDLRIRTPDGLDRRIKDTLDTDLRTANIVSDILAECGIVEIVQVVNPKTGRMIKGTRLLNEKSWGIAFIQKNRSPQKHTLKKNRFVSCYTDSENRGIPIINKGIYLADRNVSRFIQWLDSRLDNPGSFRHNYYNKKDRCNWYCNCVFQAYELYRWRNWGFPKTFSYLTGLAKLFRESIHENNTKLARECAFRVLDWGGVQRGNRERIMGMGEKICNYFKDVKNRLDLTTVCLSKNDAVHISSGFTKIYFLLIDNFIMYDGRVGAALGLLVREFCREKGLNQVPRAIEFSFGSGRGASGEENRRDPSRGQYWFPEFSSNRHRHLQDNIKASWLLKSVADTTRSRFGALTQDPPLNKRLTALQSALFMIGYDVR